MSEKNLFNLSWLFVAVAIISGAALLNGWSPAGASDDHNEARELRFKGDIISLSVLVDKLEHEGFKVIEAELEHEHGNVVYELELLDARGRVFERYYNAVTGEPIN